MNLKFGWPPRCAMLSTEPVTKLSMPMTWWPRARSKSARCEPRKPAAPVTTDVAGLFFIGQNGISFGTRASEHDGDGADQDFQIEPQRPVVNVFEVEAHPLLEIGYLVASADLPEAGEAGLDAEAAAMGEIFETLHLVHRQRARTHQAHFGAEHVEQ